MSGYQNWIVSYANPDQRPIYVGLSNTLTAVISLIAPFIGGSIVQYVGYEAVFVVALVMTLAALYVTLRYIHDPVVEQQVAAVAAGV